MCAYVLNSSACQKQVDWASSLPLVAKNEIKQHKKSSICVLCCRSDRESGKVRSGIDGCQENKTVSKSRPSVEHCIRVNNQTKRQIAMNIHRKNQSKMSNSQHVIEIDEFCCWVVEAPLNSRETVLSFVLVFFKCLVI